MIFSYLGAGNVLLTNPLWVVNTRMKMQGVRRAGSGNAKAAYKGLLDGLVRLGREEGTAALWSGTIPSLALVKTESYSYFQTTSRRYSSL